MGEFGKYVAGVIRGQLESDDLHAAYRTAYFSYQMGKFCFNNEFANTSARICYIIQRIINKKGVAHDA